ncbi:N-acetylmuramoyl-L-alanine amidase [Paenibacillus thalictri]|uniref:N-acetylmuramoyl-L-alanine amidase n=1 Tax=Paenibacillus thalictri TaxID=2527873 RepID=A0A4Q9DJ54_9BACL|nr:peptidoglycan recognition family protein [Paenibacillus thalictri]TBL71370.1 N-acetylmuramoyl-L-alanine amidase [Paenibacillus thalictri]
MTTERDIVWMGNEYTNSNDRQGIVPYVIVNHISAGTMSSMDNWFRSPNNDMSSAHFGVARDGSIHQYVDIRRMAWANGLAAKDIAASNLPVIQDNPGINPNLYSVSIEHEGMDGDLTEAQFVASVWLHKYIRNDISELWGRQFELDRYHVIGHFMVNPTGKPLCPGPKFPWDRLFDELAKGDDYMLAADDANAIIAFLAAAHEATGSDEARTEFHRLANELRKASGQEVQQ